jgi:hypothetical protein
VRSSSGRKSGDWHPPTAIVAPVTAAHRNDGGARFGRRFGRTDIGPGC